MSILYTTNTVGGSTMLITNIGVDTCQTLFKTLKPTIFDVANRAWAGHWERLYCNVWDEVGGVVERSSPL